MLLEKIDTHIPNFQYTDFQTPSLFAQKVPGVYSGQKMVV